MEPSASAIAFAIPSAVRAPASSAGRSPSFASGPAPIRPLPPVDMWGNPLR